MKKVFKNSRYIFFALTLFLFYFYFEGKFNTAHELCPFSSVCFGPWLFNENVGKIIYPIAMGIGLFFAVISIFLGRIFCGKICPLGTLQELIYKIGKKKKRFSLVFGLHKKLIYLKYFILFFVFVAAVLSVQYLYLEFCPIFNLYNLKGIITSGLMSLILIFTLSFFYERFFCRYLCPYAALMNIFQKAGDLLKIRKYKIFRNLEVCIDCNICNKNCPMRVTLTECEEIKNVECIQCDECLNKCPKENCLKRLKNGE